MQIWKSNFKYYFLLSEPWKPRYCALSTNGFFHQMLTTRTTQGRLMKRREMNAGIHRPWLCCLTLSMVTGYWGGRFHRRRLTQRGLSEPLLRAKGRRDFFSKGFRATKMKILIGLSLQKWPYPSQLTIDTGLYLTFSLKNCRRKTRTKTWETGLLATSVSRFFPPTER